MTLVKPLSASDDEHGDKVPGACIYLTLEVYAEMAALEPGAS
jgi:hypothetical protein